jgi:hypothetical protein
LILVVVAQQLRFSVIYDSHYVEVHSFSPSSGNR